MSYHYAGQTRQIQFVKALNLNLYTINIAIRCLSWRSLDSLFNKNGKL